MIPKEPIIELSATEVAAEADENTTGNKLIGQKLPGDWVITRQLPRPGEAGAEEQTGGCFSIGYIASKLNKDGKTSTDAFLKIIDIERALEPRPGTTLIQRLKDVTDSHSFECAILDICRKANMDRVVKILAQGELPPLDGMRAEIPYILFEMADGDVRKIVAKSDKLDDAWRLRVLHDVAVGLQQLHSEDIAHQDLKPSNVLIFDQTKKGAKIGDLGRASRRDMDAGHDSFTIAGARNYAPPEQVYGIRPARWEDRRQGCDLYHLGSLTMFIFTGITPTIHYLQTVSEDILPRGWGGKGICDYPSALPVLTAAFTQQVEKIKADLPEWARDELVLILLNACNPDYQKRGDPNARSRTGSPLGMDVFVSRFDRLAKRAVVELRK